MLKHVCWCCWDKTYVGRMTRVSFVIFFIYQFSVCTIKIVHDNSSDSKQDNKHYTLYIILEFVHKIHSLCIENVQWKVLVCVRIESKCDLFLTLIPRSNVLRSIDFCLFLSSTAFFVACTTLTAIVMLFFYTCVFRFVWSQTKTWVSTLGIKSSALVDWTVQRQHITFIFTCCWFNLWSLSIVWRQRQ